MSWESVRTQLSTFDSYLSWLNNYASQGDFLDSLSDLSVYTVSADSLIGSGYDQGFVTTISTLYPSNAESEITVNLSTGINANVSVQGINVSSFNSSVSNGDIVVITIPPMAELVLLTFTFDGIDFDPESGPIGTLTFGDTNVSSAAVSGDILNFCANNNSVRCLNADFVAYESPSCNGDICNEVSLDNIEQYPLFRNINNINSIKSGVITKNGNLVLGTDLAL